MTDTTPFLPLFVWLSPSFPVGAFAYSLGLEWAVEDATVVDAASLEAWLDDLLCLGPIRADGVLLAAAWRAPNLSARLDINALALALAPTAERQLETATQGTAFARAIGTAWPTSELAELSVAVDADIAYPVAVGVTAAAHGIPMRATIEAFALAAVGNLVSAALRLGPIGQSEAQAIIARLYPKAIELAAFAEGATLDDLGTGTLRTDIASMRHETQYSRLFRS